MRHRLGLRERRAGQWMIFWLALAITTTTHAAATDGLGTDDRGADAAVMPGVVVVQFKAGIEIPHGAAKAGVASFDQVAAKHQVYAIEKAFPFLEQVAAKRALSEKMTALRRIYVVRYRTPMRPRHVAAMLAQDPNVVFAEPQFIRRITDDVSASMDSSSRLPAEPNDALFGNMTHLAHLRLPEAWDVVKGEQGSVVIAIIDGGTEWRHPDLMANVWTNPGEVDGNGLDDDGNGFVDDIHGWNFAADPDTNDPTGLANNPSNARHGTNVAGAAVAVTNNEVGVAGTSWNARFMAVNAGCPNEDLAICFGFRGLLYAAMNGADIINASWGGEGRSEAELRVIETITEMGALVVAAAGNEGVNIDREPFFPAAYGAVLGVGGTLKTSDTKVSFSNYGRSVDVFAPSVSIDMTFPDGQYGTNSGTSFSSPLVAGIAALVKTEFPTFTPDQVREQIRMTSDNIDDANPTRVGLLGRGRVNAFRAVTETGSPAIRLTDWSFTDNDGNLDIRSGETVQISATFTNYLADASGVTLELLTDDAFVNFTTPTVNVGSLPTGASTTVTFEFEMAGNTPNNRILLFSTKASAGSYTDEADIFRLPVNETAVAAHFTGTLRVSVTNQCNIGYTAFAGDPLAQGVGFVTNGVNVLFEGGLLVATGPDKVSDCVRGTSLTEDQHKDFILKDGSTLEIIKPGPLTAEQGRVEIVDTPSPSPIGLSILQESYVDTTSQFRDFLILRYIISNTSDNTLTNLYAGLFFDWDVDQTDAQADVALFDEVRQMGYVLGGGLYVGTRLLTNGVSLSYHAIDNPQDIYRDATGGGFTEQEKWTFLSSGIQRRTLGATDVSQLTGAGPFTVDPGSSVEVAFAVVVAPGPELLLLRADRARDLWETLSMPVGIDDPAPTPGDFVFRPVYPHPTVLPARFEFEVAAPSEVTLTLYDILGRKVRTLIAGRKSPGAHTVVWDGADQAGRRVANGLYLARFTARSAATTFTQSQQVVVLR